MCKLDWPNIVPRVFSPPHRWKKGVRERTLERGCDCSNFEFRNFLSSFFVSQFFFLYLEQNRKRDLLKHFRAGRKIVYRSREYYFVVDGTRKKCHATRWTTMAYLWYKIPRSRPGRWQSLYDADKLNTHDPLGDCCCYEPLPSVFLCPF